MATLYSPSRGLWLILRAWWRRVRCPHIDWSPLDGCPACNKEAR